MDVGSTGTRMADYLRDHQDKVIGRWTELVVAGVRGRTTADEVRRELGDLYSLIVRVLSSADDHAAGELRAALDELSRSRARDGFTPSETALGVFSLKEAVYELVADAAELVPEFLAFSRMVDDLGLRTFEAYSAAREQIIADQSTAMLELSTPVVRLWDGIIAVPLVGTLDSARTQLVMEKLLDTLVATGADHAVIDITGVPTVDTEVAQHLLKTVSAARLLGAECTISGIRPQVAQTIVSLGIEFGDIATKATLADALALALKHAGLKVVPALMDQVPILKIGQTLFVSIQIDLQDDSVIRLQEDLADELAATGAHGVIIDITAVEIVDSFIGRMLSTIGSISRLFDAETVIVGMRPAVAITLTELGLSLSGVRTALNAEKGLEILNGKSSMDELPIRSGDDVVRVRQQVRIAAAENGLSLVDQTKLVTAASELARNTLVHGGGGTARVEVVKSPSGRAGVKLHFTDEGPGIADIGLALTDGWTSGTGLGLGLSGVAAACR